MTLHACSVENTPQAPPSHSQSSLYENTETSMPSHERVQHQYQHESMDQAAWTPLATGPVHRKVKPSITTTKL